jgi:hypothetical protein
MLSGRKLMSEHSTPADKAARGAGLAVFLVGLGLLLAVFGWAYRLFAAAVPRVSATGGASGLAGGDLGAEAVRLLVRLGFLFLMAYVASLVATKGIELYHAARHRAAEAAPPPAGASDS